MIRKRRTPGLKCRARLCFCECLRLFCYLESFFPRLPFTCFFVSPHCDEQFPGATMALTRAHLLHSNCFYCEQRPFVPEHSLRCGWDGNVTSRELWAQSDANVRASYVVDPVRPDWKTSTWGAKLIVLMSFSALLTGCFCPSRRLASCPGWLCRQRRWTITPNGLMYIIR